MLGLQHPDAELQPPDAGPTYAYYGEEGFSIARLCTYVHVCVCVCVCVCDNLAALRRDPCCSSTLVSSCIVVIVTFYL